jgi:hypothetical protein
MGFSKYAAHDVVVAAEQQANQEAADAGLEPDARRAHVFMAMLNAAVSVPNASERLPEDVSTDATPNDETNQEEGEGADNPGPSPRSRGRK